MSSIAIVGDSGTGKSSSYGQIPEIGVKGLNPKETVVINVAGKDLPFRGWMKLYSGSIMQGGNYIETSEAYTDLQKRYHSEQLIPLFELRYFDKASEGFSNSVIRILTMEGQTHEEAGNTIINSDVEVFLDDDTTPPSKTIKAVYTFCPKITYEVYDEADNKLNVTINKEFTNRYNVTLPAGIYYIKCIFKE